MIINKKIAFSDSLSFDQKMVLITLFFGSMNIFNKYYYFIFISVILFFLLNLKGNPRILIKDTMGILVGISICFTIFGTQSDAIVFLKNFSYPMCYLLGYNFISYKRNHTYILEVENKIKTVMFCVSMGAFTHYVLNLFLNIGNQSRNTIDVWSGTVFAATGQAALSLMALSYFIHILFSERGRGKRVGAIIGLSLIGAYNLILASRTIIISFILILIIAIIFSMKESGIKKQIKLIAVVISIGALIGILYTQNIMNFKEYILESNLLNRFEEMKYMEDSRTLFKLQYIKSFGMSFFGGGVILNHVGNYAHDLFLDTYSEAGIIAFILMVVIIGKAVKSCLVIVKNKRVSNKMKVLVLTMYSVLFIEFCLEPIMLGMPWLFCSFCLYQGLIEKFNFELRYIDESPND